MVYTGRPRAQEAILFEIIDWHTHISKITHIISSTSRHHRRNITLNEFK